METLPGAFPIHFTMVLSNVELHDSPTCMTGLISNTIQVSHQLTSIAIIG